MNTENIGRRRIVVGAHYGLRDWLSQRVTAVILASYSLILLITAAFLPPSRAITAGLGSSRRPG